MKTMRTKRLMPLGVFAVCVGVLSAIAAVRAAPAPKAATASQPAPASTTAQPTYVANCPEPSPAPPSLASGPTNGPTVSLPPNPYAGLSDAQQQALEQQQQKEFEAHYRAWLSTLDYNHMDLHGLPRVPSTADVGPGQELSLHDAVAHADMIVIGTVSGFHPRPFSGIETTLSVDRVLKGPPTPTITVIQSGALQPTPDWSGVFIVQPVEEPLLLPGDRAVLLIQTAPDGTFYIQSGTGFYQVVNGAVQPGPVNTWGLSVRCMTEPAFLRQLTAAAP